MVNLQLFLISSACSSSPPPQINFPKMKNTYTVINGSVVMNPLIETVEIGKKLMPEAEHRGNNEIENG